MPPMKVLKEYSLLYVTPIGEPKKSRERVDSLHDKHIYVYFK